MDKDAMHLKEKQWNLEQTGLAYTCLINDEPIASAGMKIIVERSCRRLGIGK
jgi:hypothetical protein